MIRLALVGDPVDHSLSPVLHAEALRLAGLEGEYEAIRADRALLDSVLERLRQGELRGVNVTMPWKLAALELCDVLTDEASRAGSVNTLRSKDRLIEGHSTDVIAFRQVFESLNQAGQMLVLGAGGAARAAIHAWSGGRVYVSARDEARAAPLGGEVIPWGTPVAGAVLVNATPLGMRGESLPGGVLEASGCLVDLAYGPDPTPAMREAALLGIEARDGIEFLARQAAASFRWWTGEDVDWVALAGTARKT